MTVPASLDIRPATAADTDALFEICLKTADNGQDGSALYSDPRLPGYLWAVPYREFEPEFAFVLADAERTVGYVIATPDTAAFARRLAADWWPRVQREVAGLAPTRPLDAAALQAIADPVEKLDALLADYPAHMHINLLPPAQSGGWGRRMIETELAALKARGIAGVHLGVSPNNDRAIGFYRHLGFSEISRDDGIVFGLKFRP
jgi:GNAT superfamily N-acetyltransferase